MSDQLRVLTDSGIAAFESYLDALRTGSKEQPPSALLADPSSSESISTAINIEREPGAKAFATRYDFGIYLRDRLEVLDRRAISRDYRLWTWLALYYFDQLCAPDASGIRVPFANEAYILGKDFKYDSYYRHFVRTAWLAVCEHHENSRVLLIPAGKGTGTPLAQRGELIEQLAARQTVFGTPAIIESAAKMYFDPEKGRPKRGAGGAGAGSPRRLALVVQQFELTYDLRACSADQFLDLLPKEFDRWRSAPKSSGA